MYKQNKLSAFILVLGVIFIFSASKTVTSAPVEKSAKSFSQAVFLNQDGYFNLTDGRNPRINRRGDRGNHHNNYNERSREGDRFRDRGRDRDRDRDGDGYRHERRNRDRDDNYGHERRHHRRDCD